MSTALEVHCWMERSIRGTSILAPPATGTSIMRHLCVHPYLLHTSALGLVLATATAIGQEPMELGLTGQPPRLQRAQGVPRADVSAALAATPFQFLENRGQWDSPARFIGTKGRTSVLVEPHALTIAVAGDSNGDAPPVTRFVFEGALESSRVAGEDPLPCSFNFYSGGGEDAVRAEGVRPFANVLLTDVYTGIDVRLREHGDRLEYDLLLAPGAELGDIIVRCEGIERLAVDESGRLLLHTSTGAVLEQSAPTTWAELPDGTRRPLECTYVLLGENRYGYALPVREADLPVVIDPGLEWSTLLGGSGIEIGFAVEHDPSGRIVVAGASESVGWAPPGVGAPYSQSAGDFDCFVAILDPSASGPAQFVWWTYFGGPSTDYIYDIELNAAGQIFAVGDTWSSGFPVTPNAFDVSHGGGFSDSFVTALDPVAGSLVYSTYLGGSGHDAAYRLLLEEPSRVTVAGVTDSINFPTTPITHDATFGGARDIYLTILDLTQAGTSALQYSSYLGGSSRDAHFTQRQLDIERSANGLINLVSSSFSPDFPVTPNAYQVVNLGGQDIVFVRLDTTVSGPAALVYSTFIGSDGGDGGLQVELDPAGGFVLGGFSYSANLPTTANAAFPTFVGPAPYGDAWLARFDPSLASPLEYATFIPGSGYEYFWELEVAPNGTIFGVGFTGDAGLQTNDHFPVTCGAFDTSFNGEWDGFVLALTPAGKGLDDLNYLSYFGTDGNDETVDLLVESTVGTPVLVIGGYAEAGLPTTPGAGQSVHGGEGDGFAIRIRLNPYAMCHANPSSFSPNGARLCGSGSTLLAAAAFDLVVTDLPQNSSGYFLMSKNQVAPFPIVAPSQGVLCLGSPIARFSNFVLNSGTLSTVTLRPNLNNIPPPAGPLAPGETAYFQYWYRDFGSVSNTSNGIAVTFD
jgi:hypothetical protein